MTAFGPGLNLMEIVRICGVGAVLLFVPGALIQSFLLSEPKLGFLERLPIAFVFSVGSIALLGVGAYVFGGTLETVRTVYLIFVISLLVVWFWRFKPLRKLGRLSPGSCHITWSQAILIFFVILCSILAYSSGTWLSHTADGFYHLAAIHRQIDTNEVFARGVFYDYQPTRLNQSVGSWHLVLALFSQFANVDITWLWYRLSVVIAPLLALAFYGFGLHLTGDARIAVLGTVLQFIFYDKLDFRASVYPNQAGFILLWVALTLTLLYLKSGSYQLLAYVFILSVVMVTWHLLMPELFLVLIITYFGTRFIISLVSGELAHDIEVGRLLKLLIPFLLTALPLVLYRAVKSNLLNIQNFLSDSGEPTFKWILRLPGGIEVIHPASLYAVDPRWRFAPFRFVLWLSAYLTLPFLFLRGIKRSRKELVLFSSLIVVPLIVFNPLLVSIGQGLIPERAIVRLALLPPYGLVLAWFFFEQGDNWIRRLSSLLLSNNRFSRNAWKSRLVLVVSGVILTLAGYLIVREGIDNLIDLYDPASTHPYSLAATKRAERLPSDPAYAFIINNSSTRDVIASDPISGYYLGGLTGRPVISVPRGHYPPFGEPLPWVRREESVDILHPSTSLTDTMRLLDSYNARFIWIDSRTERNNPNASSRQLEPEAFRRKFEKYPDLFPLVYQDENVTIFSYQKTRGESQLNSGGPHDWRQTSSTSRTTRPGSWGA